MKFLTWTRCCVVSSFQREARLERNKTRSFFSWNYLQACFLMLKYVCFSCNLQASHHFTFYSMMIIDCICLEIELYVHLVNNSMKYLPTLLGFFLTSECLGLCCVGYFTWCTKRGKLSNELFLFHSSFIRVQCWFYEEMRPRRAQLGVGLSNEWICKKIHWGVGTKNKLFVDHLTFYQYIYTSIILLFF